MTDAAARKVVFLTGTRADFGKLKSLMLRLQADPAFDVRVFVTGMHMLAKYGYTCEEVERSEFKNIHKYINQNSNDSMDQVLAKTIGGLSDYVKETSPDMLIVHGDRVEALAGATVGALNNILTGHIEGGEVSGTVDELIRHAVSKLSHLHFVANERARTRLIQLGERDDTIHVVGSPDIDIMNSQSLPGIDAVKRRYDFGFANYGILLFHPVTSELEDLRRQIGVVVDQVIATKRNYVVIYPNNDHGSDTILEEYRRFGGLANFRVYPSMRFEYFLSLLRHADFIIGNSSAAVREAPHFGVPAINLGSRQYNRVSCASVADVPIEPEAVGRALAGWERMPREPLALFGHGDSAARFHDILRLPEFWKTRTQKYFVDRTSMVE
ncbi:UDP-N-acetylglucosamine 2-epimerase [Steroidobacter agaridevorans]|uniref:UDP-N-acetylglucosamine 2-epimerase n=1 Tax=Steroidobacter agaridevorans TaxID=2695856 RepID=UPI001329C68F|nr:UDP-N-acetylglucosamine 2-epimerase [Steroidobacter agaridevorans]GFE85597.1 UDP-N-acetyl glucosamine 2-epimerase [Steroidobacter agaridevorans]